MTFGLTEGGQLRYVITHKVILANQKTKFYLFPTVKQERKFPSVYYRLCMHTCNVCHNMLSGICRSIGCHLKRTASAVHILKLERYRDQHELKSAVPGHWHSLTNHGTMYLRKYYTINNQQCHLKHSFNTFIKVHLVCYSSRGRRWTTRQRSTSDLCSCLTPIGLATPLSSTRGSNCSQTGKALEKCGFHYLL